MNKGYHLSNITGESMEPISEELVEETWQDAARFTPARANKEMSKVAVSQPHLLSFMMEFTEELARQEKELAIFMFFVVYRMFQKGSGRKIKKISAEEIIECYEYNEDLMERLEGVHEKFLNRIATTEISRQPYVMKYVTETLVEAPEGEEPVPLTEEGMGVIFLLLKTVVDLLDKTARG
jgi:hypothetical protein